MIMVDFHQKNNTLLIKDKRTNMKSYKLTWKQTAAQQCRVLPQKRENKAKPVGFFQLPSQVVVAKVNSLE